MNGGGNGGGTQPVDSSTEQLVYVIVHDSCCDGLGLRDDRNDAGPGQVAQGNAAARASRRSACAPSSPEVQLRTARNAVDACRPGRSPSAVAARATALEHLAAVDAKELSGAAKTAFKEFASKLLRM